MTSSRIVAAFVGGLVLLGVTCGAVDNVGAIFSVAGSARAQGMAGAFSALAENDGAVMHNPAALGWADGISFSTTYSAGFGGVNVGSIGLTMPYVGVMALFLNSGTIPTSGGSFYYASQGIVASVGVPIGPLGLGLRWRFFRASSPVDGSGWTMDPVLAVRTDEIRASLLLENAFSVPVSYSGAAEDAWDPSLRLSVALMLQPTDAVRWNACVEVGGLFASNAALAAGLEAWVGGIGARVGLEGGELTYGLSARFEALEIDWAYAMRDDLGGTHRIGLVLRF